MEPSTGTVDFFFASLFLLALSFLFSRRMFAFPAFCVRFFATLFLNSRFTVYRLECARGNYFGLMSGLLNCFKKMESIIYV